MKYLITLLIFGWFSACSEQSSLPVKPIERSIPSVKSAATSPIIPIEKPPAKPAATPPIKPNDQVPAKPIAPIPKNCLDIIKKFGKPADFLISSKTINSQYTLLKDLSGLGKSGALPLIVKDKSSSELKLIKIFSPIKNNLSTKRIKANKNFLEIFHACQLANLGANQYLPSDVSASIFFTKFYDVNFLSTSNPFDKEAKDTGEIFPFFLAEGIEGIPLAKISTGEEEPEEILGFSLLNTPPMVLESILLQIIIALKSANLALNFMHYDLHTGNILLSKKDKANFPIYVKGKKLSLIGPLIKIIDFGLSSSSSYKSDTSTWIKSRPFIKELDQFIKAASGKSLQNNPMAYRAIHNASTNQDIRMFNLMLYGLKDVLNERGSKVPDNYHCADYDSCMELVSRWWK